MKFLKLEKKWIIAIIGAIIVAVVGAVFFYENNSNRVFTRAEYVKEVIVQNQSFENLLGNFLDQVVTYDGTKESTEKLENTATKLQNFVSVLKEKLGPKVPYDAKSHYDSMMAAYDLYIDAVNMYKKAVPKNLGDERTTQMKEAEAKLAEAKKAMKNIE